MPPEWQDFLPGSAANLIAGINVTLHLHEKAPVYGLEHWFGV